MKQQKNIERYPLPVFLIFSIIFFDYFSPFWFLKHILPSTKVLVPISTIFFYLLTILTLISNKQKVIYKPILFFAFAGIISIIFAENTGIARTLLLFFIFKVLYFSCVLTFIESQKQIRFFFLIMIFSSLWLSLFGLTGKGMVHWHMILNNEDAFGPLMTILFGMTYFFYLAEEKYRKLLKLIIVLSVLGVIASFARGAFVALLCTCLYIWWGHKEKLKATFIIGLLAIIVLIGAKTIFPENNFWNEMATITEQGKEEGTGRARWEMWEKGLLIFKDHPLVGSGPRNYGWLLPEYIGNDEDYRFYKAYLRVPHNIYIQILSEGGLLGFYSFVYLLWLFFKNNKKIKECYITYQHSGKNTPIPSEIHQNRIKRNYYYSLSIEAGMIAFLVNAFFYDLLYYNWMYDLLLLNQLIYRDNINLLNENNETS